MINFLLIVLAIIIAVCGVTFFAFLMMWCDMYGDEDDD